MGFLQRLFGGKKPPNPRPKKGRRLWSFSRSFNNTPNKRDLQSARIANDTLDANKHAIAVAAATAAVAEAALAAAHAAAEVVRLTSGGPTGSSHRLLVREMAAVRIQSAFRAYLARRALRALKALVKLQALVRGHIVRKQTADMLRRMQTLVRLQARARASRAESLNSSTKFSNSKYAVPASPDKDEYQFRVYSTKFDAPSILTRCGSNSKLRDLTDLEKAKMGSNCLDRWMEDSIWSNSRDTSARHGHVDDDKSDKILEVDTWKPRLNSQQSSRTLPHGFPSGHNNYSFMASESPRKMSPKASYPGEAPRIPSAKAPGGRDQASARTGENSPQVHSASSRPGSTSARRSPFTPTRSECSWGYFNGCPGHPNYMAYTESSRAKFRSQSAPRQRLEFDRYGSMNRSLQGFFWEPVTNERECGQNSDSRCRAYPASERLSRPGTPNRR